MVETDISGKTLTEVLYILNNLEEDIYNKIPNEIIQVFEEKADRDYKLSPLFSQNIEIDELSQEAKAIIAYLYKQYICNEEEKKEFDNMLMEKELKEEEQRKANYDVNNIFKNKNLNEDTEAMIIKKENIVSKIISKIKLFFKMA